MCSSVPQKSIHLSKYLLVVCAYTETRVYEPWSFKALATVLIAARVP